MHIIELIEKKRDGHALTTDQITWFIEAYTAGELPDYQASALLMAIYLRGMNRRETVDLTLAMAKSGDELDLHDIVPFTIDKHSSGGVGDKVTLIVLPIVAACGVPVGKMSGRGLGASGGTIDKMESFDGWSPNLTIEAFRAQLAADGIVLAGQSADLAPADGKLYALRDVTGTVASIPLIAASIMSKKLAAGSDGIVLDVKVGNGAFMRTVKTARELAEIMVNIGTDAGRKTVALLTDMNQPLGHAIGNALEVQEALATLRGEPTPPDLWKHCLEIAAYMIYIAGRTPDLVSAETLAVEACANGSALAKFRAMVGAQGGDVSQVDQPDTLPHAKLIEPVLAQRDGYIAAIDTGAIGWAAVNLGAGRKSKGDVIDHAVGFVMPVKVGQKINAGDLLCTIYANDTEKMDAAHDAIETSITWSAEPVATLPHGYGIVWGTE